MHEQYQPRGEEPREKHGLSAFTRVRLNGDALLASDETQAQGPDVRFAGILPQYSCPVYIFEMKGSKKGE